MGVNGSPLGGRLVEAKCFNAFSTWASLTTNLISTSRAAAVSWPTISNRMIFRAIFIVAEDEDAVKRLANHRTKCQRSNSLSYFEPGSLSSMR
jgi:hypothetical protein